MIYLKAYARAWWDIVRILGVIWLLLSVALDANRFIALYLTFITFPVALAGPLSVILNRKE
jgi:hypothetical protein